MLEELRKRRKQALDANRMKIQRNGGGYLVDRGTMTRLVKVRSDRVGMIYG